jgi:bacterial/archaeal transporter family protein
MLWVYLAVLSSVVWAGCSVFDKILRTKYQKDSLALTASFGIFSAAFIPFFLLFIGFPDVPLGYALLAFAAGCIITPGIVIYLKAMSVEEASRVMPLTLFQPLFVLIVSVIFFSDSLTPARYAAFALLLSGSFLISTRDFKGVFSVSKALPLMAVSSLFPTCVTILLKFLYSSQPFWKIFFIYYIGTVFGELFLFVLPSVRKSFSQAFSSQGKAFLSVLFLENLFAFSGRLMFNIAIPLGPVALVTILGSLQSLFMLIIATFLSIKFPMFLKEAVDAKTIGLKIFAIVLMLFGIALLYL